MSEKIIAIFGSGSVRIEQPVYKLAYELGAVLAQAGFTIANGGYGGTMLAAAKGAAMAGGNVIAVTCSAFGKAKANEYSTREIVASSLDERLDTLMKLGNGYVVLPGSTGTLLELAKVWEFKNKGFLEKQKLIILVGDFWKSLIDLIGSEDASSKRFVQFAADPDEVKERLLAAI
ncbi:LOG family protein [Planctomycetota bacterium]